MSIMVFWEAAGCLFLKAFALPGLKAQPARIVRHGGHLPLARAAGRPLSATQSVA
jgi:hypothetical protein